MIDRIIGINQNAMISNQEHIDGYTSAYKIICNNPIFGLPIFSSGNEIITLPFKEIKTQFLERKTLF